MKPDRGMGVAGKTFGFVVIGEFGLDKAEKPKARRIGQNSSDCADCNHPQHNVASDGKRR